MNNFCKHEKNYIVIFMPPIVFIYKFTDLNTSLDLQQLTYVYKILQLFYLQCCSHTMSNKLTQVNFLWLCKLYNTGCCEKVIVTEDTKWERHLYVPYSAQRNGTFYFNFSNKP